LDALEDIDMQRRSALALTLILFPLRDVLANRRYARVDLKENLMQGLRGQDMYKTWPVNLWVTIPGESGCVFITGYLGKAGPPR
jgi:hypothetical protein